MIAFQGVETFERITWRRDDRQFGDELTAPRMRVSSTGGVNVSPRGRVARSRHIRHHH
jgi:hypothetical protein